MSRKRKTVTMIVTVSVPAEMSAADARARVRGLINDESWHFPVGPMKARSVKSARTLEADAAFARQRLGEFASAPRPIRAPRSSTPPLLAAMESPWVEPSKRDAEHSVVNQHLRSSFPEK